MNRRNRRSFLATLLAPLLSRSRLADLHEVIRYGVTDSQGDTFAAGCFGHVDGKRVPVTLDFDQRSGLIGMATMRSNGVALWAECGPHCAGFALLDIARQRNLPFAVAAVFRAEVFASHAKGRHFLKLTLLELAIVPRRSKDHLAETS